MEETRRSNRISAAAAQRAAAPVLVGGPGSVPGRPPVRAVPILEGNVVKYVEVHCSCGRVTVLELSYPEDQS